MLFRPIRGSLNRSMAECVEIDGTMDALRAHLDYLYGDMPGGGPDTSTVEVKEKGYDPRIGWQSFMVLAVWGGGGKGPIGWTNAMPTDGTGADKGRGDA